LNSFLTNLAANGRRTDILERIETPAAALTLTRSATLAITTAGTTITWQTETRNRGFNWSGTTITIPTSGYYSIFIAFRASAAASPTVQLVVNTVSVARMSASPGNQNRLSVTAMRYFTTGDTLSILMDTATNFTLNVNAENAADESPILHIVQMTGAL
jgi:hypothetical protein